jgi:hypothetical protein
VRKGRLLGPGGRFDRGFAKFLDFVSETGQKIEQLRRLVGIERGKAEPFLTQTQQAKNTPGVFDVSFGNAGPDPVAASAGPTSQQGYAIGPGFESLEKERLGDSAAARYSYHPYFAGQRSKRVLKGLERYVRVPVAHEKNYFEIIFHESLSGRRYASRTPSHYLLYDLFQ